MWCWQTVTRAPRSTTLPTAGISSSTCSACVEGWCRLLPQPPMCQLLPNRQCRVCVCVRVGECARACVCGVCCVRGSAMCVVCVPVWCVCARARASVKGCTRQGLYTHPLAKQEDGQKAKGQRVHLAFKLFYSHAHVRARAYTRTHTHTHRTLAINAKVKLTFLNKGWDDNNPPSFHFSADEIGYWEVDPPACWRASWHACRHVACLHVAARLLVHVHK